MTDKFQAKLIECRITLEEDLEKDLEQGKYVSALIKSQVLIQLGLIGKLYGECINERDKK